MPKQKNPFDTAIMVLVKRFDLTFTVIIDEYEPVQALKTKLLHIFDQANIFSFEEELTEEEIRLTIKNRVTLSTYIIGS